MADRRSKSDKLVVRSLKRDELVLMLDLWRREGNY